MTIVQLPSHQQSWRFWETFEETHLLLHSGLLWTLFSLRPNRSTDDAHLPGPALFPHTHWQHKWQLCQAARPSGSLMQTQFHKHLQDSLLTVKHSYSHHPYCCYVYIPGTTRLHIPLAHPSCSYYYLLIPNILFLHILFVLYFLFYCTSCISICKLQVA